MNCAIVLAGGKGTRMNSEIQAVPCGWWKAFDKLQP